MTPAQQLISYTKVSSLQKTDLKKAWKANRIPEFIVSISNAIDLYEIIYTTKWHDGTQIKASGLYFQPLKNKTLVPQLIYHHGTQIKKERTREIYGENIISAGFSANGYAVIMPDYIGLGKGDRTHLYQHSDSEADAAIDMYFAVQELNNRLNYKTNSQLYLTGYSQGGHACMATHKKLQEHFPEIEITASSPMSGSYDMSGAQSEVMFSPYPDPAYLPYLLMSYDEIYNITDGNLSSLFRAPYDSIISEIYTGDLDIFQINDYLPEIPVDVVQPELINQYLNNPNFIFKLALDANNLTDWKTDVPTQFCYCAGDKRVLKENSIVAYNSMKDNGSRYVSLRKVGNKIDHITCAGYAFVYTQLWFDGFKKESNKGGRGNLLKRFALSLKKSFS